MPRWPLNLAFKSVCRPRLAPTGWWPALGASYDAGEQLVGRN